MSPQRPSGVVLLIWLLLLPSIGSADADLRTRLEQLRDLRRPTVLGVSLASVPLLDDFYYRRNDRHVWYDRQQVEGLLDLIRQSVDEGFQSSDFHARAIRLATDGHAPSRLTRSIRADVEILLSDSLLRLIHHRRYGKVDPKRLDKSWNPIPGPYARDLIADLEWVARDQDLRAAVTGLVSKPAFQTRLQQGLARYRKIAAAGGWPKVPAGKSLRPHMQDPRVPIVRERLRVTGDFNGPASEDLVYDKVLKAAVLAFQKRHRLKEDGIVGSKTRLAMNTSATKRVDQIRINLERMRWISAGLSDSFLLVDITEQQAELFRNGQAVWSTRVIVGRPGRPTPTFRDEVEYIEINPSWIVPPTILSQDILPAMRKDPGYLDKRGLQVVTYGGSPVSPGSVDWYMPSESFPYMIRQPPGTRNALGRIKFIFPNRHAIYLHDTPRRSLFRRSWRLFSSGCVRVERPWKLAELILNQTESWSQTRFKRLLASGRTRRVYLEEPLTILLAYWTAKGDADGKILFRKDVYSRDKAVLQALNEYSQPRILYPRPEPPKTAAATPL